MLPTHRSVRQGQPSRDRCGPVEGRPRTTASTGATPPPAAAEGHLPNPSQRDPEVNSRALSVPGARRTRSLGRIPRPDPAGHAPPHGPEVIRRQGRGPQLPGPGQRSTIPWPGARRPASCPPRRGGPRYRIHRCPGAGPTSSRALRDSRARRRPTSSSGALLRIRAGELRQPDGTGPASDGQRFPGDPRRKPPGRGRPSRAGRRPASGLPPTGPCRYRWPPHRAAQSRPGSPQPGCRNGPSASR